ncbi:hypothetical protein DL95DRAFT_384120 [Leptodontidium sp. 2 PMI_412]|nr:hypothetical protein DL95DRAFT_384120 [Leptodontidium sp. 2 PMI_412]
MSSLARVCLTWLGHCIGTLHPDSATLASLDFLMRIFHLWWCLEATERTHAGPCRSRLTEDPGICSLGRASRNTKRTGYHFPTVLHTNDYSS